MRNFEILDIEIDMSGPGPDRLFRIQYRAYIKKQWVERAVHVLARNEDQAREKALTQFSDKL